MGGGFSWFLKEWAVGNASCGGSVGFYRMSKMSPGGLAFPRNLFPKVVTYNDSATSITGLELQFVKFKLEMVIGAPSWELCVLLKLKGEGSRLAYLHEHFLDNWNLKDTNRRFLCSEGLFLCSKQIGLQGVQFDSNRNNLMVQGEKWNVFRLCLKISNKVYFKSNKNSCFDLQIITDF